MASKRSENTYQKIDTIFMRDVNNIIMPFSSFVRPEFEFLRNVKWRAEEKIDGTSMRIEVASEIEYNKEGDHSAELVKSEQITGVHFHTRIAGKTDNANIPPKLKAYMEEHYPEDLVLSSFGLKKFIPVTQFADHKWVDENGRPAVNKVPSLYTIYGEGYGAGIQKGSNYIKDGVSFIVFDVKVDNMYLLTESRDEIANKLGAPIVPFIGYFTIDEAIDFVRAGFKSTISENKDYAAEGLVLRTDCGLLNRRGERLITKIKTCDFEKYRNKYGTDRATVQLINDKYSMLDSDKEKKQISFTAVIPLDTLMSSGRIYPKANMEKVVKKYLDDHKEKVMLGELEPDREGLSSTIRMLNVSHQINKLEVKGSNLFCQILLLDTPMGKVAQDIYNKTNMLRFAPRAAVHYDEVVQADGSVKQKMIIDDLISIDII